MGALPISLACEVLERLTNITPFIGYVYSAKDVQKCTSSWHGGMVDAMDLKSIGGKHHTSSSLVASISHMRHFIP